VIKLDRLRVNRLEVVGTDDFAVGSNLPNISLRVPIFGAVQNGWPCLLAERNGPPVVTRYAAQIIVTDHLDRGGRVPAPRKREHPKRIEVVILYLGRNFEMWE